MLLLLFYPFYPIIKLFIKVVTYYEIKKKYYWLGIILPIFVEILDIKYTIQ